MVAEKIAQLVPELDAYLDEEDSTIGAAWLTLGLNERSAI